ncbi:stage II sporulation protein M [Methanolobus bombayensis]|uniref:stage II sporulation protein M n=1 Tax=Methanolobus bombayensis TaxID=38023 RepID=UPI001AE4C923|nr:stage II sporulation protein M [Methanolobus bombayensis]MBP1909524.1 putative membrane protein SpoIIM required for sporulation [Methanolobus bombayensis]
MINEENKNINRFKIGAKDIKWTIKVFLLSVLSAFILAMIAYILTFMTAEPEPASEVISDVIMGTASAATSKVTVTSTYINPMWAIFFFNSLAAGCAVIGTGLFIMVHKLLLGDIAMRPKNRYYAGLSILMEKAMMPLYRALITIASRLDRDLLLIKNEKNNNEGTIWQYCGYGKYEYRMFSYILPFTVPLLILLVNGVIMGILLAFFTFNGALTGFELFGEKGAIIGLLYNVVYFFISILPHGIIEIPVILLAATVGYHFAYIQSHDVVKKELFNGDKIESLLEDYGYVEKSIKEYLFSAYAWKMVVFITLTLLVAAYIETYVTLGIVDRIMTVMDSIIEPYIA